MEGHLRRAAGLAGGRATVLVQRRVAATPASRHGRYYCLGRDDDGSCSGTPLTVTLANVPSSIVVTKTADPTSLPEPVVRRASLRSRTSAAFGTITAWSTAYGNLDGRHVRRAADPGAGTSYSCSFSAVSDGRQLTPTSSRLGTTTREQISGHDASAITDHPARSSSPDSPPTDPGAGRQTTFGRRQQVGGRLGDHLGPVRRQLRQPRRQGHLCRAGRSPQAR